MRSVISSLTLCEGCHRWSNAPWRHIGCKSSILLPEPQGVDYEPRSYRRVVAEEHEGKIIILTLECGHSVERYKCGQQKWLRAKCKVCK